jgi:hypothetical protein
MRARTAVGEEVGPAVGVAVGVLVGADVGDCGARRILSELLDSGLWNACGNMRRRTVEGDHDT